jgi:hypothetical protein
VIRELILAVPVSRVLGVVIWHLVGQISVNVIEQADQDVQGLTVLHSCRDRRYSPCLLSIHVPNKMARSISGS